MSHNVRVSCRAARQGWACSVTVGNDPAATHHEVTVSRDLLAMLRPGLAEPDALVRDSFAFLLEREPRESILGAFDLPLIERYFPGWRAEMRAAAPGR
jgi:hypothetical protein